MIITFTPKADAS